METTVNARIHNITINLFLFCLVVFILVIAKNFLVPIAWALLISCVFWSECMINYRLNGEY